MNASPLPLERLWLQLHGASPSAEIAVATYRVPLSNMYRENGSVLGQTRPPRLAFYFRFDFKRRRHFFRQLQNATTTIHVANGRRLSWRNLPLLFLFLSLSLWSLALFNSTTCWPPLSIVPVHALGPAAPLCPLSGRSLAALVLVLALSSQVALRPKFSLFEYRRFKPVNCNYARVRLKGFSCLLPPRPRRENGPAAIRGSKLTYR